MPFHPRPILKRNWSRTVIQPDQLNQQLPFARCKDIRTPHVHFPPTPTLISTHTADSPGTYDRRPIILSPPLDSLSGYPPPVDFEIERTERGRSTCPKPVDEGVKGSYFHPRAFEVCEPENLDEPPPALAVPPLLLRDSSPSSDMEEDSDEVFTPPEPNLTSSVAARTARLSPPFKRLFSPENGTISAFYAASTQLDKEQRMSLAGKRRFSASHEAALTEEGEGCLGGF